MTDVGGASAVEARARRAASLRVWVGALLFLAMACGYGWFIWHLPQPRIFVVLSAKSESIAYRVTNPDMGVMRIVGMRASALDGSINACVDAVVTPAAGARVEYRRGDENFFTVTIDPRESNGPAVFLREGGGARPSRPVRGSIVFSSAKACGETKPSRFPIWGPAEFGEEMRPPGATGELAPGLLTQGTISVYGHAHQKLLGMQFPAKLYLVTSVELPAGSVLAAKEPDGELSATPWTGIATVSSEDRGFDVAASTQARTVSVSAARAEGPDETAQKLDLGEFSQLTNDPNVVQIQVLGGAFLFLLQGIGGLATFLAQVLARLRG